MSRTKHILSYSIPIVILLFFLFGSFFAPHDPTATNIRGKYLSSSAEYPRYRRFWPLLSFHAFWKDGRVRHCVGRISYCHFARYRLWHLAGKDGTPQKYSCRKYFERSYSDSACGLSDYLYPYWGIVSPPC